MRGEPRYDLQRLEHGVGWTQLTLRAGRRGRSPKNPEWTREIIVSISPTGQAVHVWVDGVLISRGLTETFEQTSLADVMEKLGR